MDAVRMTHLAMLEDDTPSETVNKWDALRELTTARAAFGLSDRDMAVLQALLSFHPGTELGEDPEKLVVFPSNASICDRLNGMPSSTMRRHLGRLVDAGVILRRDSPNGKRYARTSAGRRIAYGFDLRPLVLRHREISALAEETRARDLRIATLRETVSLMRRDLASLADYGLSVRPDLAIWDAFSDIARLTARALRRNLTEDDLERLRVRLLEELDAAKAILEPPQTAEMSTSDVQIGQHQQRSNKDSIDSELAEKRGTGDGGADAEAISEAENAPQAEVGTPSDRDRSTERSPSLPLTVVMSICREILSYAGSEIRDWHDFVRLADIVGPMMGISPDVWDTARRDMGPEEAAVVVAAMLERFGEIRSPGAYLRTLSRRAADGAFSSAPMVMALSRREAA